MGAAVNRAVRAAQAVAQAVEEGAEAIVRYALIPVDGPTGDFFDRDGAEPW